jgi:nucleotide-binding universal stress UspA family protein
MMRENESPPPAVVVGIDGSKAAVRAALWAVDEAVSRDIPLRLVYAIDPGDAPESEDAAHRLATAEIAVRYAFMAVEATDKPVKIEVEIVQGTPTVALTRASRSAPMICVGSIGLHHFANGRVGSTAKSLAALAHCPVAIITGGDRAASAESGWVVVEVDETAESTAALQRGVDEALLRHAPLHVLMAWHSTDATATPAECGRLVRAQLDRRLAGWTRRHPDLDIRSVAVHGSMQDYLNRNAGDIQLVVSGDHCAALHHPECSALIVNRQRAL